MYPSMKTFHDSVHGCILMPPICVRIIDTPEFQRLRYVKQLGVGYFVYPGAMHNRFEHSIGVSHLAGKLVEALKFNQNELGISDRDVLCVKVAGLCHDLGHGPFSHLWDQFMKHKDPHYEHEEVSCRMLDYLLANNGFEISEEKNNEERVADQEHITSLTREDVTFIKALIRGKRNVSGTGRGEEKSFLYDIICNDRNGIDVDKWEYLLRDSRHLGISISFSYERLILNSRVKQVANGGRQICFRDKVAGDIMNMFCMRYELHKTAYQHKVCHKLTQMLVDAFKKADCHFKITGSDGRRYSLSECANDMMAFSQLTDDVIQRMLWVPTQDAPEDLLRAQKIIRDLYRRQLYKDVGKVLLPHQGASENWSATLKEMMARCLASEGDEHYLDSLKITELTLSYGSKGSNPLEKVVFYTKHGDLLEKFTPEAITASSYKTSSIIVLSTSDDATKSLKKAFERALEALNQREPLEERKLTECVS